MFSQSLSQSQTQGLRQTQRQRRVLSQEQRQEQRLEQRQAQILLGNQRLARWSSFVETVWHHTPRPSATCQKCYHQLSPAEIMLGFKNDPHDVTTGCPKCRSRFEATNLLDRKTGRETAFCCGLQVLEKLRGLEVLEVEEMTATHPDVYYTSIWHFGTLLNAFGRIGIDYRRECFDWRSKAKSFLGLVPDKDVAEIFGASVREVSAMRKSFGIPRPTGRKSLLPSNWSLNLNN